MNKLIQIVTNNPAVYWTPEHPFGVVSVEGSPLDVLDRTEALLQQHWRLVSAPLPPNVPIMRAPYRSLVIEESEAQYDAAGLIAVEKARQRYTIERKHGVKEPNPDFAEIDRQMLLRALDAAR